MCFNKYFASSSESRLGFIRTQEAVGIHVFSCIGKSDGSKMPWVFPLFYNFSWIRSDTYVILSGWPILSLLFFFHNSCHNSLEWKVEGTLGSFSIKA